MGNRVAELKGRYASVRETFARMASPSTKVSAHWACKFSKWLVYRDFSWNNSSSRMVNRKKIEINPKFQLWTVHARRTAILRHGIWIFLGVWLLGFGISPALAHGDLHPRIEALTREIATNSGNAALYFERGELHRVHREWTNALADYDQAQKLNPSLVRVDFCRGRLWLEAENPKAAITPLNRYLAFVTNDSTGYATRARARAQLGDYRNAANDFTRAVALTPTGSPEFYVERAEALSAAGSKDEAVRGLDEGIARMGPLVTLELVAIDIETQLKRYDSALKRVDAVMARLQRKESWLVRRAEILKLAGRNEDSKAAYREALAAIEQLPPAHRNTRATLQLEASVRSALK